MALELSAGWLGTDSRVTRPSPESILLATVMSPTVAIKTSPDDCATMPSVVTPPAVTVPTVTELLPM